MVIKMGENLKYPNAEKSLTHEQLNKYYGKIGMFFKDEDIEKAYEHRKKYHKRFVTKIVNYDYKDIVQVRKVVEGKDRVIGAKPKEGSSTHKQGWLVN